MQAVGTSTQTSRLCVEATQPFGVVDITGEIARRVSMAGVHNGVVWIFCQHTTCGVLINEFEDGLIEDLSTAMMTLVGDGYYAHDDLSRRTQNLQSSDEPANGPAHVRQILFGATTQMIPVVGGELALGTWQSILFIELDVPRPRSLLVTTLG